MLCLLVSDISGKQIWVFGVTNWQGIIWTVAPSAYDAQVWVILLASALAQLVSCVVTCPVEAVRIRVMTCDKRPEFLSFVGTAQEMLEEKGLAYFWSGLGALCFRELPFAIAKVRAEER